MLMDVTKIEAKKGIEGSFSPMQLIVVHQQRRAICCRKHRMSKIFDKLASSFFSFFPPTRCPGRWAWLMPQTTVESFGVWQKPRAYRASPAQGGDSRGQISQMPNPEFEVTTKIGGDRRPEMKDVRLDKILPKMTLLRSQKMWVSQNCVKLTAPELDTLGSYLLTQPHAGAPPGSLPSLYLVESPTKVKQRQVDRLNNDSSRV